MPTTCDDPFQDIPGVGCVYKSETDGRMIDGHKACRKIGGNLIILETEAELPLLVTGLALQGGQLKELYNPYKHDRLLFNNKSYI